MEQSETLVELTPEDVEMLKGSGRSSLGCLINSAVVLSAIAYFVLSQHRFGGYIVGVVIDYVLLAIVAIIVGFILLIFWLHRSSYKTDIRDGRKKIIIAPMESQREKSYTRTKGKALSRAIAGTRGFATTSIEYEYYIKVEGKEYEVDAELYYKLKPGDFVEIHVAPHSDHIFRIVPVNQQSGND